MDSFSPEQTNAGTAAVTTPTGVDGERDISCGEFLRRAREERQLTLEHIAQVTKIPVRHLTALERDEFKALPDGLYRRAEVRAYADAVGLDRNVAVARLDHALEEALPHPPAMVQPPRLPSMPARLRAPLLMVAGAAVMTGGIAFAMWTSHSVSENSASIQPASAPASRTMEPPTVTHVPARVERSTPAVAASTKESRLTVITDPMGARVTVNGVGRGVTPVTVRHLTPGPKAVRVTLDGYVAEERLVQLEPGEGVTSVRIPLRTQENDGEASPDDVVGLDGTR